MILTLKKAARAAGCIGILALAGMSAQAQTQTQATAGTRAMVRGTVQSVDATSLQVSTPSGPITLAIHAPLTVYSAQPSDLAHVKNASFVGVTSVKQANGGELAKEIHIFPEALRGTGAGSHMMDAPNGHPTSNRMTNGSVTSTQVMTNAPSPSRMTNGTVKSTGGPGKRMTLTVNYPGGMQIVAVPADVSVTLIARTDQPLAPGQRVFVQAQKGADGSLVADRVMLASRPAPKQ